MADPTPAELEATKTALSQTVTRTVATPVVIPGLTELEIRLGDTGGPNPREFAVVGTIPNQTMLYLDDIFDPQLQAAFARGRKIIAHKFRAAKLAGT